MLRKATKTALLSAAVLSGACVAQAASAALITDFDYTVDSAFTSFTGTGGRGTIDASQPGTGIYNSDPTKLSWGTVRTGPPAPTNPQSSISITPQVTGSIETNGAAQPGATFTHNNIIIPDTSNTLNKFNLNTNLNLTATAPSSESGVTPSINPISFNSFFTETENAQPCATGSVSVCDDLFVLTDASTGLNSNGNFEATQNFTADGTLYTVMLQIMGLGQLNADQCKAAGANTGCVGFQTQESNKNQFTSQFTITANQAAVPEPGNLAMLAVGLGLIGFGFYARRRNFRA